MKDFCLTLRLLAAMLAGAAMVEVVAGDEPRHWADDVASDVLEDGHEIRAWTFCRLAWWDGVALPASARTVAPLALSIWEKHDDDVPEDVCGLGIGGGTFAGNLHGLAVGLVAVGARNTAKGLVFGGLAAIMERRLEGLMVSPGMAGSDRCSGLQVGVLWNECGRLVGGTQIGLLNHHADGIMPWLPLFNWGQSR